MKLFAAVVLALLTGCPFAVGVPGSRTDVSPMTTNSNGARHAGVQVATGAHWASLNTHDQKLDVGAGYIYQHLPREASGEVIASSSTDGQMDQGLDYHGGYLSLDSNIHRRSHWRTWAGTRGELWFHPDGDVLPGGSVRLGIELFAGGSKSEPVSENCVIGVATSHGTTGVGLFIDAGARLMPGGTMATTASAGITLRLPSVLIFGLALPLPGC